MITANNYRELLRIAKDPTAAEHLVEEEVRKDVLKLLNSQAVVNAGFSVEKEFRDQYTMIKRAVEQIGGNIQSKEDLDIIKEAQKYLMFILRQEEKLTDIKAVHDFKESVLEVLDGIDPVIKDKVIRRLNDKSIS